MLKDQMKPSFSIIMPVYNVAQYLRECLNSVLAQTFTGWEAVCVDDGSTDGSGTILDEYAASDKRIKVIHQSNAGVCISRQRGLDVASGEYVTWCDPDDFILGDYLKFVSDFINEHGRCDVIGFDYETDCKGKRVYVRQELSSNRDENLKRLLSGAVHGSTWSKMFRRQFIVENALCFANRRVLVCEDLLFVFMLMLKNPKTANTNRAFYYYRVNDVSVSHTVHKDDYYESLKYVGEQMYQLAPNDCIKDCVRRWMAEYRFLAFKEEFVSNGFFKDFFPELTDISSVRCSWMHKVMFKFAVTGCVGRTIALFFMNSFRDLKGTR